MPSINQPGIVGCIPCARYYLEQVDDVGLSDDEVLNSEPGGCLEEGGCDD